jgi:hypothetical protein
MLVAMAISIVFIVVDLCSVLGAFSSSLPIGVNPFWKIAFVFKCLTDSVILDDFKTSLDKLRAWKMARFGKYGEEALSASDRRTRNTTHYTKAWEELHPDGTHVSSEGPSGFKTTIMHGGEKKDSSMSPTAISVATDISVMSSTAADGSASRPPQSSHQRADDRWTEESDDTYPLKPLSASGSQK